MTESITNWVEEVRQTISHAGLNYEIWWVLASKDTDDDLIKAFMKYSRFQTVSHRAHFITLMVDLYKLYETKSDRYCIPGLIKKIKSENLIEPDALLEIENIYKNEAKPLWKKVSILRNSVYAHNSATKSINKAFAQADIRPYDIRDLIEISKKIANLISRQTLNSAHAFNLEAKKDFLRMLNDLRATGR